MTKLILLPGSLICDAVGLTEDSDNRQILRMFLNTLIWGAAGVITILLLPFWASAEFVRTVLRKFTRSPMRSHRRSPMRTPG